MNEPSVTPRQRAVPFAPRARSTAGGTVGCEVHRRLNLLEYKFQARALSPSARADYAYWDFPVLLLAEIVANQVLANLAALGLRVDDSLADVDADFHA